MTVEDPFFVVKNEVVEAVNKTKDLYQRWCELKDLNLISKEEIEWTTNELRNSFRSIEWDLEDLEETVCIVEKNPKKFKIDCTEINTRKAFIDKTKEEVQEILQIDNVKCRIFYIGSIGDNLGPMKNELTNGEMWDMLNQGSTSYVPVLLMKDKMFETKEKKMRQGLLGTGYAKYTRLENEVESPTQSNFIEDTQQAQQLIIDSQEEQIERVGATVGTLKSMSNQIRSELDEQSVMLDDLGYEMEVTESKLDATVTKIAKALHMTSDKRQWTAIGVLLLIIFIVILLFFIL